MGGQKLNNEAVEKFLKQKKFKKSCMQVEIEDTIIRLKQHGNTIAKIVDNEIFISNAGWKSVTTKEKLNCLLRKLNAGYIQQKDFIWYYKTNENITIEFPNNTFISVENYLNHILLGGY